MFEMKWEDVYTLWKNVCYQFSEILSAPVTAETVFVECNREGYYLYGLDWLQSNSAQERKQRTKNDLAELLYFTKPTNKGTIQTAEMLVAAQNDEERAAIWIAATANELSEYRGESCFRRYSNALYVAACNFLEERYYLWHHAMKRLVPEIMIPRTVLENIVCKDAQPVMGLIQLNTVLLKNTWNILRYSSLKDGEFPKSRYRKNIRIDSAAI